MHIAGFIAACFFGAWALAYVDHRAKLREMIIDLPGTLFGMVFAGVIFFVLYKILRWAFAGWA